MELYCQIVPRGEQMRARIAKALEALGVSSREEGGIIAVDYDGPYDQRAANLIKTFESFGCDRIIVFRDWGHDEGQTATPKTSVQATLGGWAKT